MPNRPRSSSRVCPDCDGFPVVAITTGTRLRNGSRATLRVTCNACQGTGTTPAVRALLVAAATAAFTRR